MKIQRRRGVSELMGTLVMVAITLVAGAAMIGFVNGQASNSVSQANRVLGNNLNALNERETIGFVSFGSSTTVTLYIYDAGQVDLTLLDVIVSGQFSILGSPAQVVMSYSGSGVGASGGASCSGPISLESPPVSQKVKQGNDPSNPTAFTLTLPSCVTSFISGQTYTFTAIGSLGSTASALGLKP